MLVCMVWHVARDCTQHCTSKNWCPITFSVGSDVNWFQATICGLPWVTSISRDLRLFRAGQSLPAINHDLPFIRSTNDLVTLSSSKKKFDSNQTLFQHTFFTDVTASDMDLGRLEGNARVLISIVVPSGKSLVLRLKHSGSEDMPLEVKLGPTIIQLNPPSRSLLTIDDISLHPIQDPGWIPGTYEDHTSLSFEPGVQNNIVIDLKRKRDVWRQGHFLHDIELLDESGLEYPRDSRPYLPSLSIQFTN